MTINRRRFLQHLGFLSASIGATALPARPSRAMTYDDFLPTPPPVSGSVDRVIVIGAGFAGLTVANALSQAGVPNLILEARTRTGGRISTESIGGSSIDVGAAWIHGPIGNPVAQFATQFGIPFFEADTANDTITGYDPLQGFIDDVETADAFSTALGFTDPAVLAQKRSALGANASVQMGIDDYLGDLTGLTVDQLRIVGFLARSALVELDYAAPSTELSLAYYFEDLEFGGDDSLPTGGYAGLVDAMAGGMDIRLGEQVSSISYDANGVTVVSTSGVETGSHVVVTVPLAILKSGAISFAPALPTSHTNAIGNLGVGSLEKIVLQFPTAFWGGNRDTFYYVSSTPGEYPFFIDWTTYAGQPTLICFVGGQFARDMASSSDAAIEARIMAILTEIFGTPPPSPTALRITRWRSDPFSQGSYSHVPIGASPSDMDVLSTPVGGRVLFAGEATNSNYYATVHGAMLSGIREAKRLLQQTTVTLPEPMGWWPVVAGAAGLALMKWRQQSGSASDSADRALN